MDLPPGLHILQGVWTNCFLLVEKNEAVLIDTGLFDNSRRIEKLLEVHDLGWENLKAILLTHGHLDHAANAHKLKSLSGAQIHAYRLEQLHVDGVYPYKGINRLCGWMEALGRLLLHYKPVEIDIAFEDGDVLHFWGGLRVVHLPGHTTGHCGFHSQQHDILFCGDLFANMVKAHLSPPWFTTAAWMIPNTFKKVRELNPRGILPCHTWEQDPEVCKQGFERVGERISSRDL